jgi:hypothetical protein
VLSDRGFEDEQKFSNLMLLDIRPGSFDVGDSTYAPQAAGGSWGESIFIRASTRSIDRRAGGAPLECRIKEILLPAWMAYANWGLSFGSIEAFYQFEWNNFDRRLRHVLVGDLGDHFAPGL